MRGAAPARFSEWVAPAAWESIELISDLHLAANTPGTVAAWERYLANTSANAVVILGDLFETWVGDDSRHEEFEAYCVDALRRTSRSRTLAFMVGNRDFLVGADMLEACTVRSLADPTVLVAFGSRYLLTHGDELCIGDADYQRFRSVVRAPEWQRDFLARPLQERRETARKFRAGSIEHQSNRGIDAGVDIDVPTALLWLEQAAATTLIHGHTHRPATQRLGAAGVRHVLSDWCVEAGESARAQVLRLDAAGVHREPFV